MNKEVSIISNIQNKPKKTAAQLVRHLESKGVKFNIYSRVKAYNFLSERNNYMRLASYRKNYEKDICGKYINLEFAYLVELSTIDMHLRTHIIKMCLDVEHCLKVQMLHHIENNSQENGYDIVNDFLSLPQNSYIIGVIQRNSQSAYCGDLIKSYFKFDANKQINSFDCPIWVLMELLQFGDFLNFYCYYYTKYNASHIEKSILNLVKSLRNACAHNNCILHDLHKNTNTSAPTKISKYVSQIKNIGKQKRQNRLSSQFLLELSALLYVYDIVVSTEVKKYTYRSLKDFANGRLVYRENYFKKNYMLKTSIEFLKNLLTI